MTFGRRQESRGLATAGAVGRTINIIRVAIVFSLAVAGVLCRNFLPPEDHRPPAEAVAGGAADIVFDDSPLKAFPNTRVTYYDVPGTDTAAIVAYVRAHGPVDPRDNTVGAAKSSWEISWRWPRGAAACDKDHVQLAFKGEVLLPRLVDAPHMGPEVARAWQHYFDTLVVHEAGHLRHAYQHMGNVAAAIRSATCADAPAAARAATQALADYDAAYDHETGHGDGQGARLPAL